MKKIFLLLTGGVLAFSAQAQFLKNDATHCITKRISSVSSLAVQQGPVMSHHSGARTTATPFFTETFGSGTYSTLPTGWTAGTITGPGTWHWDNVASTSTYSLGTIASTTASNGWMIFDSDSLGTVCHTCAPAGWLQSPVINCSAHTTVKLSFEELFKEFNDSCFVWVSNNGGTTWTHFNVLPNDGLAGNVITANPQTVNINISSVAGGQASVIIRFVYNGEAAAGGGYSWLVDDVNVSELDPHDVGISGSFMWEPEATAFNGSIFETPLEFVDSVFPVTLLTNYGANAETNVAVNATIYQGTSSVYTNSNSYTSLVVSAFDSVVQFPGYLPNAQGNYTCALSTTVTGDANAANNVDTVVFSVSDTTWQENIGDVTGAYYVHNGGSTPASFYQGTRFDVPTRSAGDTVSGFGVAFDPTSVPTNSGGTVMVQLYSAQATSTGWSYVGTSVARAVTSADISTSSSLVWADFRIDPVASGGITPFILQPGTSYAAVVQINNVSTDLLVEATAAPNATGYSGYFGQSDTSNDNGVSDFGGTAATGNASAVPLVRMYFGSIPVSHVGVTNLNYTASIGNPYPNPANTSVSIPFTLSQASTVTATLMDIMGQVINTQTINAAGGQAAKATFSTTNLADGIYLYTVEYNGQHTNGRIVVAH